MACITFIRTSKLWRCHKPWHQATHVPHVITKSIMSLLPRRWMQTTVQFGCEVVWGCHQAHDLGWVEYLFHSCSIKIIHQRHYNFQKDWAWYLWSHDFNPFHSTALPPTLLPCKVSATRRAMRRSMNLARSKETYNIQYAYICIHWKSWWNMMKSCKANEHRIKHSGIMKLPIEIGWFQACDTKIKTNALHWWKSQLVPKTDPGHQSWETQPTYNPTLPIALHIMT